MVIDTSAIFATIAGEPDARLYRDAILAAPLRLMSAATLLETRIVLFARGGEISLQILDELVRRAGIVVVPFDEQMAVVAFVAFRLYGKGRGNKAQLNILDCAAYALAKSRDQPLLYKGADFAATDIRSALSPQPERR